MKPAEIQSLIEQHLPGAAVSVSSPDNVHFEATVVSPAFAGKRSLQRHRLVYGALGAAVGNDIHALTIQAFTPEEWDARAS